MSAARPDTWVPFYPTALAAAWVTGAYVDTSVDLEHALRSFAVVTLVALTLQVGATVLIRRTRIAALVTLAVLLVAIRAWPILICLVALAIWMHIWSVRGGRPGTPPTPLLSPRAAEAMNLFSAFLLAMLVLLGFQRTAFGLPSDGSPDPVSRDHNAPDIYLFLLDGHARADTMLARFDTDISGFIGDLEGMGFEVADASNSNYDLTVMTLVSMFHGEHVKDVVGPMPASDREQNRALSRLLDRETPVTSLLRAGGYEIVAIPSPIGQYGLRSADRYLDPGHLNNLEFHLVQRSIAFDVLQWLAPNYLGDQLRGRTLDALSAVRQLGEEDGGGRFILAHLMVPHPPFVFDEVGDPVPLLDCMPACSIWDTPISEDHYARLYRQQTAYTHQLVLDSIEQVLAASEQPPIVIVMSDHGARAFPDDPQEQLRNFFAAYTPDAPSMFADDTMLSEVFPRVLAEYLGVQAREPKRLMFSSPAGPWPLVEYVGAR
jgi:hypothetical protein